MILRRCIPRWLAILCLGLGVSLVAACNGGAPALARTIEDKEKVALAATVAEFDTAMRNKMYDRIAATVPPKVVNSIAKKAGADPAQVRVMLADLMKKMMAAVKIESFSMDLPGTQFKELGNGLPYALIPTNTIISMGDKGRFAEKTFTLALLDGSKWYLVRTGDVAQLVVVREVYPEFTSVEFPQSSMEVLKQ